MTRWHNGIEKIASVTKKTDHSIEDFFELKNYKPKTEEEKHIFEEFSLITSSMAILIYVAKADNTITFKEQEQIINDIIFQLEQRPYEFTRFVQKFGNNEKEIIFNIYDKILNDYKSSSIKLDKIIDDLCLIYQNNPVKRYYIIRLCYYCALSDNKYNQAEQDAIQELAIKMHVPSEELKRIEEEVKLDISSK